MRYLKENTATRVTVGPFLDVTDGVTPETALTVTACHLTFMVDDAGVPTLVIDAAPTASAGNNDMVHVTSDIAGFYDLELTAAQTNYTGRAMLMIHDTDVHLPVFHEFQIVSANVYDSLFADGDVLDVNVSEISADSTAADNAEAFFDGTGYAGTNNVIPTVTTLTGHTAQTGDTYALANGATGFAAIDTVVDSIKADIDDGGRTDLILDAILVDTGTTLDTKLNDIQGATFSSSTDSLEALRNRGDAAWTGSAITSDSGTAQAGAAGTITLQAGASASDDTYNGQLIYISSGTGAGQSRAISDYTGSSKVAAVISNWATTPDATSVYEIYPDEITEITAAPTAAAVADAVWDENTAGHTTGGTFGEQVKNDIDAILVDTSTTLDAQLVTIDANVDAILVDTAEIGTAGAGLTNINLPNQTMDITGNLSGSVGSVTGAVGSVTGAVGSVTGAVGSVTGNVGGNVTGSVGSLTGHTVQTGDTFALANGLTGFTAIDTVVDAIKVKTDQMNFGVANQLDANVESINATTVVGIGTSGNKWRA